MLLEIVMTRGPSSLHLEKTKKRNALNGTKVDNIRDKLSDGKYVYGAIYCLASILTDKIMDMGGEIYDDEKK